MSDSSIPRDLVDPACSSWWPMGPTSAELSDWREKDVDVPVVVAPPVILASPAADKLRQSEFEAQAEMYRTRKSLLCDCSNCIYMRGERERKSSVDRVDSRAMPCNHRSRTAEPTQTGADKLRQSDIEAQAEMYRTRKSLLCDCSNCINARERKLNSMGNQSSLETGVGESARQRPLDIPKQSDISQGGITDIRSLFRYFLPSDEAIDSASIFSSN